MNQTAMDPTRGYLSPDSKQKISSWMRQLRHLLLCFLFFLPQGAMAFDQSHKQLTKELQKYVKTNGVLYAKWKEDRKGLDAYLDSLAKLSPEEYKAFTKLEKRSLWLNAYNALAIKLVLDNYPIKGKLPEYPAASIRQIPNTWDAIKHSVAGREVSLYTIAHDNLRKAKDCRNHFAITPASRGGAILQKKAFNSRSVDDQLAKLTEQFMSRPENLHCNPEEGSITVSQIFRWFPLDFMQNNGGPAPMLLPQDDDVVRDYVMQFLPEATRQKLAGKQIKIIYAPYDWTLNDASPAN